MANSNLKKDNLSIIETIALSVAIIAPTAAMSINVSLMSLSASFSEPLIFFISMVIVGLVSYSVIKFNHYFSSSGSLYTFTEKTLGEKFGFLTGWALLLAYVMLAAGCCAELGAFFSKFLNYFGIQIAWLPLSMFFSLGIVILGIIDAKISTRIMLAMEGISILLIFILSIVILFKVGSTKGLSPIPFKTNKNSFSTLASTSVLAFLSFIGFESASSLGEETKNPKKFIPLAIGSAVFVTGIFYLLSSYSQVIGFGVDAKGLKALSTSSLPLTDLSTKYISRTFGIFLLFSASLSCFSCSLGSACAGSRILFAMSKDGIISKKLSIIHKKHCTPYIGIILITIVAMFLQLILFKKDGIEAFNYLATIGSLAIIVSYLFTSIGAVVFFKRTKEIKNLNIFIPILSIAALLYVLYANIYPIPEFPTNTFPYIVLIWLVIGFILNERFNKNAKIAVLDIAKEGLDL
ncbi:amino acid transporter [Clostridium acetobutylicum]|uniref:Amino acid permease n=2 Tax=Clostridium acetobutylicum TaxID=1488 RepID=Q97KR5_CLOAB|nr:MULTISPECIES: APC family permease [Clostridium]AAK78828.1 Amino acid permease [Clostridium acetobutylicum ATCC 824]ADZ19903.1 Amino acid permease [Clostridium acetobutylicum EA 2018]AEI31473.1 amino acid permease [Clostridium acetobutylicum DSM 1731]AWV80547.1 APC family permease [Clostridium acetobutylicum]MBC2392737.1 APC family permease [Clostridium acetobutylicum]